MKLNLPKPGRYILAVSGGLDSVCLLDLMSKQAGYELIVAHFDHGIRPDSAKDKEFVANIAERYGLKFVSQKGNLGPGASEAKAREARYAFLDRVKNEIKADAIITAHHLDDRYETLIINLIRGTGRKGLSSISETASIKRPLLGVSRDELKKYAKSNKLIWHEDPTNSEDKYLRNYIRSNVTTRLKKEDKKKLESLMDRQLKLNYKIDNLTLNLIASDDPTKLNLSLLNVLPHKESREVVALWLRQNKLPSFNKNTIERLTVAAKTKRPGTRIDIYGQSSVRIEKGFLALSNSER